MSAGLIAMELSRGDGSMGTFLGVHGGLAMKSIVMLGSEEQKQRWLPPMARLEKIGAFALTEPDHGSDSVALETSARRDGDHWVLNGAEEVDRQRHHRRRRRGVGPRRRGRPGQGIPRGERHAGLQGQEDRAQGLVARGLAGRDRRWTTCGCPRRTGCPGANTFSDTALRAGRHPRVVRVGRARARRRRATTPRSPTPSSRKQFGKPLVGFQLDPATPGQDARQGHRDAAVLPPHRRLAEARARSTDTLAGPGQDAQHHARPARCSPRPETCWAATGSCSTST